LSPNDYIGSCAIDLKHIFKIAFESSRTIHWDEKTHELMFKDDKETKIEFEDEFPEGKYKRKFWVPVKSKSKDKPDELKDQGSILISVDVVTKDEYFFRK